MRLLGVGPEIWLTTFAPPENARGAFDVVLDMTAAWIRLGVSGSHAPRLIAKGCAVDLHPRCFPAGACAAAGLAGFRTIVWRPDDEGFELWVSRSYALSFWSWLIDAAAEFGNGPTHPEAATNYGKDSE
jgi:sarcosine oxidase subunit gamma